MFAAVIAAIVGSSAHAQWAGAVSVESDTYLRGYSISANQPAVTGQIDYDSPIGVYVSGSATGTVVQGTAQFVGWQGAIGYARRLNRSASVDLGISRIDYHPVDEYTKAIRYTEIYAGASYRPVTFRLAYSPAYRASRIQTLYADLAISQPVATHFVVSAHFAELLYLTQPAPNIPANYVHPASIPVHLPDIYDWSLVAARQFGPFELRASLIGAGTHQTAAGPLNRPAAVTVGAAWYF